MKVYEGRDLFVAITGLQRPSINRKTGPMAQAWVLPRHEPPGSSYEAEHTVCGDCPQRWTAGGGCYVLPFHAPAIVWRRYVEEDVTRLQHRWPLGLRITAYGDPAFVDVDFWDYLRKHFLFHTAYTHQWKRLDPDLWGWCMASCDSIEEAGAAQALGWEPFLVLPQDEYPPRELDLSPCPAMVHPGRVTCSICRKCDGLHGGVWVHAHGARAKYYGGNV